MSCGAAGGVASPPSWTDLPGQLWPQPRTATSSLRVPEAQARELAALIPDSRLVLLDSRNHILLQHEPAWPVFLAELDRFLAAPGSRAFA